MPPTTQHNFRLPPQTVTALGRLTSTIPGANNTTTVITAIECLSEFGGELAARTAAYLVVAARAALREALSDAEIAACLDVTNSWYVEPHSASGITIELEDADAMEHLSERHGVDVAALVAKLRQRSDFERATLTIACRTWWDAPAETRPPATVAGVLAAGRRQRRTNGAG